jgi:hypothetical protein
MTRVADMLRAARRCHRAGDEEDAARRVTAAIDAFDAAATAELRGDAAHSLASYFRDMGLIEACETYAAHAVAAERETGREARLANHLMFLVGVLSERSRHAEALVCGLEGLALYRLTHGEGHGETRYVSGVVQQLREAVDRTVDDD